MKLAKALSHRIKALREKAGLSQQDVATRGELSLSLVAKLEQAKKSNPRAATLLALADALGVKPGALLDDLFAPTAESPAEEKPVKLKKPGKKKETRAKAAKAAKKPKAKAAKKKVEAEAVPA